MDEIQDLTLNRAMLRQERRDLIDRQFQDFRDGRAGHHDLPTPIVHCRIVVHPLLDQQIEVDKVSPQLAQTGSEYYDTTGKAHSNDVAFRGVNGQWRPILRGKKQEEFYQAQDGDRTNVKLASRCVKESCLVEFDFAISYSENGQPAFHYDWLIGFFSDCCMGLEAAADRHRQLFPASMHVAINVSGGLKMIIGRGVWESSKDFPDQLTELPEFAVSSVDDLNHVFMQLQTDLGSMVGWTPDNLYSRVQHSEAG
jgi:hypothetical protein